VVTLGDLIFFNMPEMMNESTPFDPVDIVRNKLVFTRENEVRAVLDEVRIGP
jgi:hypothetical protein